MFSSCPFCDIILPIPELEWHVNAHLVEDELAKDMELAQQIALVSPSSSFMDEKLNYMEHSDFFPERTAKTSASICGHGSVNFKGIFAEEKASSLVSLQMKSTFYKVDSGLMPLLRKCLESEGENCSSIISGYIDHYQSIVSEDSGWGCGWRNIQMLSSHLLTQRHEARGAMFGGSGFVPDIPSLQRWLEIAWERGFDITGSNSFNQKIYGSMKWIGATECAALFRSFGLRARIVDFDGISSSLSSYNATGKQARKLDNGRSGGRIKKQAYGPMDKFLDRRKHDDFLNCPSSAEKSRQNSEDLASHLEYSSTKSDCDNLSKYKGKINGHQILVDWVWNYFTKEAGGRFDSIQHVCISEKTPLYFQHDGHSRTIVGIQRRKGLRGSQDQYFLLVFDPAQRTADLERSLTNNFGWQKLIKRGVHTLRKPQYQLCYVDRGIASEEEMEQLKTIDNIYFKV